jgi:hypothetical protein|tara:strand:+ start:244 stop:447 length:204 start_codon:yes stop_codon:yes gene_type:complete
MSPAIGIGGKVGRWTNGSIATMARKNTMAASKSPDWIAYTVPALYCVKADAIISINANTLQTHIPTI